jgi:hypothetical protein
MRFESAVILIAADSAMDMDSTMGVFASVGHVLFAGFVSIIYISVEVDQ